MSRSGSELSWPEQKKGSEVARLGRLEPVADRFRAAVSLTEDKPDFPELGSPVSPLRPAAATHTSSSSSSSGSAAVRKPCATDPGRRSHSGELSEETSPTAGDGRDLKGAHRRSCSGSSLIFSGGGGSSTASSPVSNVLPAGNICPSGKIGKTGMALDRAGGVEMLPSQLLLPPFLLLISHLTPAVSDDLSSYGCFWTESCQSKWLGGCGAGLVVADQSENCNGICGESSYPPCLPFHTHFHCCKPESPRVTNRCSRCENKLDFGVEYVCCTDCSDPYLIDKTTKLGFCRTGAELAAQVKPREVFKWVAGPWMKCSSPCDGGVRYRDVGCYGSIDDSSIKHYPVDDSRCAYQEMPVRQEPCNLQSCGDLNSSDSTDKSSGISGWLIALLVLIGLVAIGGVGFAGYIYYKRRTSAPSGFVYIMLEGYS